MLDGDTSIQLIDTAWTKLTGFSTFNRVRPIDGENVGFEYLLNECILAGEYAFFNEGNLAPHQVAFMPKRSIEWHETIPWVCIVLCRRLS